MSAILEPARQLDASLIRDALQDSGSRSRMAWIADQMKLSEGDFLPLAAKYFKLADLDMASLRRFKPDFNQVSFSECQRRNCLIGRLDSESQLTVFVTDPMDTRIRHWLEVRLQQQSTRLALATSADLHAYLVSAEKSVRAMDAVKVQQEVNLPTGSSTTSISISGIDATESPVVRLVDSTLYDALRSGASDIHLETHPGGMVTKYSSLQQWVSRQLLIPGRSFRNFQ